MVGSEVFTVGESTELLPSNGASGSVNWLDPPQTTRLTHGNHDPMALDSSMLESSLPNRRFVGKLEPALDVPILAASEIYRHLGMQLPQEFKMITYDALLVSETSPLTSPFHHLKLPQKAPDDHPPAVCRVSQFDSEDIPSSFQGSSQHHPIFKCNPPKSPRSFYPTPDLFAGHDGPIFLNNSDPNEERLNLLLGLSSSDDGKKDSGVGLSTPSRGGKSPEQLFVDDVKVDVTLRIQLGQAPALMLLITDQRHYNENPETARSIQVQKQITICFEVGLNGQISVVDTAGLMVVKRL
ncbi:hypothetical protein PDIDSM_7318 [Penicillium digitatum]|nr:hypothetical protein PDIDSM_7318 [Penicillium digitatum]